MKRKNLYPFFVSFVLLVAVIFINRKSFNNMIEYAGYVDHTRQVITSLEKLSNHFKSAQIYTPTYSKGAQYKFYALYKSDADQIYPQLAALQRLTQDNILQHQRMDTLAMLIKEQIPTLMQKNIAEIIAAGEAWRLD